MPKKIDIKEFRELGFLQEANRQFFHPLGLALEISIDENGNESLGGIWDYRDDLEGIHYNLKDSPSERIESFKRKLVNVEKEKQKHKSTREKLFGNIIEPIPKK